MPTEFDKVVAARDFLADRLKRPPEVGVVLGSGLAAVSEVVRDAGSIPYEEIPHWPRGGVEGHRGELIQGSVQGASVAILSGRAHLYEGFSATEVVFGVRVLGMLGARALILTNASGAVNESWRPGRLAMIRDHINLQGTSPALGESDKPFGMRFVDLAEAYCSECGKLARDCASKLGIDLFEGVYAAVLGPNYETPAEVRYLRAIGADMVGMSTVQETIAARQIGVRVLGISVLSNRAPGLGTGVLSHEEVLEAGRQAVPRLGKLLEAVLPAIAAGVQ